MESIFSIASEVTPAGAHAFGAKIPDGWQQGRGAFGGLVVAILLRAMEAECRQDGTRRVRSFAAELCGPALVGPVSVEVRVLRRGRSQTNLRADMVQAGQVVATATAVFSDGRVPDVQPRMPSAPITSSWRDADVLELAPPLGPVFTPHYEYRPTGALPYSQVSDSSGLPTTAGFVRVREKLTVLDAPAVLSLLDAWWPTFIITVPTPRPIATVSFGAQLFAEPSLLEPSEPLFYVGRMEALCDGFCLEVRELWSNGQLVATNQQTIAILA